MARVARMILGPHPLSHRWRVMLIALGLFAVLFGLHHMLGLRSEALPLLGMASLFVALHMLVLRILHPALVRRVNNRRTITNRFLRWYLSTGD